MRISNYLVRSPVEWAKEMDELYSLLGPGSAFLVKLAQLGNNQHSIDVLSP